MNACFICHEDDFYFCGYIMSWIARHVTCYIRRQIKYDPRLPVCLKPVMGEERMRGPGCADTWDRRGSDHPTIVVTSKDIKKPLNRLSLCLKANTCNRWLRRAFKSQLSTDFAAWVTGTSNRSIDLQLPHRAEQPQLSVKAREKLNREVEIDLLTR